jgi:hypothetical protein
MANRLKGEVDVKIGDRMYTLCVNHGALIEMESQLDKGIMEIAEEMASWGQNPRRMRLTWVRALLYASLRKHYPRITLQDVDELMGVAQEHKQEVLSSVINAMSMVFGSDENKEEGDRPTNGDARDGIGKESSLSTSPSDTTLPASGTSRQAK